MRIRVCQQWFAIWVLGLRHTGPSLRLLKETTTRVVEHGIDFVLSYTDVDGDVCADYSMDDQGKELLGELG